MSVPLWKLSDLFGLWLINIQFSSKLCLLIASQQEVSKSLQAWALAGPVNVMHVCRIYEPVLIFTRESYCPWVVELFMPQVLSVCRLRNVRNFGKCGYFFFMCAMSLVKATLVVDRTVAISHVL